MIPNVDSYSSTLNPGVNEILSSPPYDLSSSMITLFIGGRTFVTYKETLSRCGLFNKIFAIQQQKRRNTVTNKDMNISNTKHLTPAKQLISKHAIQVIKITLQTYVLLYCLLMFLYVILLQKRRGSLAEDNKICDNKNTNHHNCNRSHNSPPSPRMNRLSSIRIAIGDDGKQHVQVQKRRPQVNNYSQTEIEFYEDISEEEKEAVENESPDIAKNFRQTTQRETLETKQSNIDMKSEENTDDDEYLKLEDFFRLPAGVYYTSVANCFGIDRNADQFSFILQYLRNPGTEAAFHLIESFFKFRTSDYLHDTRSPFANIFRIFYAGELRKFELEVIFYQIPILLTVVQERIKEEEKGFEMWNNQQMFRHFQTIQPSNHISCGCNHSHSHIDHQQRKSSMNTNPAYIPQTPSIAGGTMLSYSREANTPTFSQTARPPTNTANTSFSCKRNTSVCSVHCTNDLTSNLMNVHKHNNVCANHQCFHSNVNHSNNNKDYGWWDRSGPLNGLRRIPGTRICFATSMNNYLQKTKVFDIPNGFSWPTQAEYLAEHWNHRNRLKNIQEWIHHGFGGWNDYTWKYCIKTGFVFRDTFLCMRYVHSGMHVWDIAHVCCLGFNDGIDNGLLEYDEMFGIQEGFAGLVLLSDKIFDPPVVISSPTQAVIINEPTIIENSQMQSKNETRNLVPFREMKKISQERVRMKNETEINTKKRHISIGNQTESEQGPPVIAHPKHMHRRRELTTHNLQKHTIFEKHRNHQKQISVFLEKQLNSFSSDCNSKTQSKLNQTNMCESTSAIPHISDFPDIPSEFSNSDKQSAKAPMNAYAAQPPLPSRKKKHLPIQMRTQAAFPENQSFPFATQTQHSSTQYNMHYPRHLHAQQMSTMQPYPSQMQTLSVNEHHMYQHMHQPMTKPNVHTNENQPYIHHSLIKPSTTSLVPSTSMNSPLSSLH